MPCGAHLSLMVVIRFWSISNRSAPKDDLPTCPNPDFRDCEINVSFVRKAELPVVFLTDRFRRKQTFKPTKPVRRRVMSAFTKSGRSRKMGQVLLCGQTGQMRMQRNSTRSLDRITALPAAAQRDFPKPDIQIVQIGQTPIQTFAAPGMSVSHADKVAVACTDLNVGLSRRLFGADVADVSTIASNLMTICFFLGRMCRFLKPYCTVYSLSRHSEQVFPLRERECRLWSFGYVGDTNL